MGGGVDPDARVGTLPAAEKSIVAIARAIAVEERSPGARRADRSTAGGRRRAPARGPAPPARERHRHRLRHPPARRGVPHRRSRDRAARRPPRDHRGGRRYHIRQALSTTSSAARSPSCFIKPSATAAAGRADGRRPRSRARSARSPSASPPARSWGWSACAAPATTSSAGRSSATSRSRPAPCRWVATALRVAAPRDAIRSGIGFVSSKRGEESLARSLTVRENLFINPVTAGTRLLQPIVPAAEQTPRAPRPAALRRCARRAPERVIATLSGGNQQKVIVARWMEAGSRLLVLEEPTFGVDVGSKAEIYRLLQEALDQGPRGPADLVGLRGGRRHLPSRADLRSRPGRRPSWRAPS